jgi:hypothetical protein
MFVPGRYWMASPAVGTAVSSKNKPYIFIEGDITHQRSGTDENGQPLWEQVVAPQKRTVFLYLSDAAFNYTADKLDALGWNGDFKAPALSPENSGGIEAECVHEPYAKDGESPQLREKWNLPGGGGIDHKAADADVIRKLNAMWKQRKSSSPRPARGPAAVPAGGPADPIPFDQQ